MTKIISTSWRFFVIPELFGLWVDQLEIGKEMAEQEGSVDSGSVEIDPVFATRNADQSSGPWTKNAPNTGHGYQIAPGI